MRDYSNPRPTPEVEEKPKHSGNVTRRVAIGLGAIGISGAAAAAAVRFGLLPNPFAKPEPEPEVTDPEPEETPEPATVIDAGTYEVGRDIREGVWQAQGFATDVENYLKITRADTVYTLDAPTPSALRTLWANQVCEFVVEPGDTLEIAGHAEFEPNVKQLRNIAELGELRCGLLRVGVDVAPGTWYFEPLTTTDYVDCVEHGEKDSDSFVPAYTTPDTNDTWQGRLTLRLRDLAKADKLDNEQFANRFQGLIVISEHDGVESPTGLSNVAFSYLDAELDPIAEDDEPTAEAPALDENGAATEVIDDFGELLELLEDPRAFVRFNEACEFDLYEGERILPLYVTGRVAEDADISANDNASETTDAAATDQTDAATDNDQTQPTEDAPAEATDTVDTADTADTADITPDDTINDTVPADDAA